MLNKKNVGRCVVVKKKIINGEIIVFKWDRKSVESVFEKVSS